MEKDPLVLELKAEVVTVPPRMELAFVMVYRDRELVVCQDKENGFGFIFAPWAL
ncbi:MAG: hypothetical protein PHW60_13445 [Kiritimatiellae bacterium]|nr:hypothetical protein [Kiritimatiellia bacterium]